MMRGIGWMIAAVAVALSLQGCGTTPVSTNTAPAITSFTAKAQQVTAANFQWAVSDSDGDTLTCALDANGDGSTDATIPYCGSTTSDVYTFSSPGEFTAKLTVDDGHGHAKSATTTLVANGTSATPATWTRFFGGSSDTAYAVATDASGDAYVTGSAAVGSGYPNVLLAKYDAMGNQLWSRSFGSTFSDVGYAVAVDGGGEVYVAGSTDGDMVGANAGGNDVFLAKYDSSGTQLWVVQFGTSGEDEGYGLAVDASGNAFVGGGTAGGIGGSNAGKVDAFIAKYDSSGNRIWARQPGTAGTDLGQAVAVDGNGNVFLAGWTDGDLAGTNAGVNDAFLVKYDSSGNLLWSRQFGTSKDDKAYGVAVGPSGNSIVAGYQNGDFSFAGVLLVKYDSAGNQIWNRQLGGTSDFSEGRAVSLDADGNAVLAGFTNGTLGTSGAGGEDGFVAKYDANGAPVWVRQFATTADEYAYGVSVDASANALAAGNSSYGSNGTLLVKYLP